MREQIRGAIIEGQSYSGKTSLFNAIKRQHGLIDQADRTTIFRSEHYSQTLNNVHGDLVNLSREENLKFLSDRIGMLEHLSAYADNMGLQSRRSRGLFYVFERFLLNYSFAHKDKESKPFKNIEERHTKGFQVVI